MRYNLQVIKAIDAGYEVRTITEMRGDKNTACFLEQAHSNDFSRRLAKIVSTRREKSLSQERLWENTEQSPNDAQEKPKLTKQSTNPNADNGGQLVKQSKWSVSRSVKPWEMPCFLLSAHRLIRPSSRSRVGNLVSKRKPNYRSLTSSIGPRLLRHWLPWIGYKDCRAS